MDHSDLDRAYSCAKTADAATLGGDFARAARAHREAAELFAKAGTETPENPGSRVLQSMAKAHCSRAAYLSSGKAKQQPLSAISAQQSPIESPGASMRASRTIDSVDDLVARSTTSILKSLETALDSRDASESFYLVDPLGPPVDLEAARRSARAIIKQEMSILARELKERDQRVHDQYEGRRRLPWA